MDAYQAGFIGPVQTPGDGSKPQPDNAFFAGAKVVPSCSVTKWGLGVPKSIKAVVGAICGFNPALFKRCILKGLRQIAFDPGMTVHVKRYFTAGQQELRNPSAR